MNQNKDDFDKFNEISHMRGLIILMINAGRIYFLDNIIFA